MATPTADQIAQITALYQQDLGRAPDAGGLSYWAGQLASGAPLSQIGSAITGSQEGQTYTANNPPAVSNDSQGNSNYTPIQTTDSQGNTVTYYSDPNGNVWNNIPRSATTDDDGNVVPAVTPTLVETAAAASNPYIQVLGLDPVSAQSLYNLSTTNPSQFYNTVGSELTNQMMTQWQNNENNNYSGLQSALDSLKTVSPTAYYTNQLNLLGQQMGWGQAENFSANLYSPIQSLYQSLIPGAEAAGLTPTQINSALQSNYQTGYTGGGQEIANAKASSGNGIGSGLAFIGGLAASVLAPELAPEIGAAMGITDAATAAVAGSATIAAATGAINAAATGGNIGLSALTGAITAGATALAPTAIASLVGGGDQIAGQAAIANIANQVGLTGTQVETMIGGALTKAIVSVATGNSTGSVLDNLGTNLASTALADYAGNISAALNTSGVSQINNVVSTITKVASTAALNGGNIQTALTNSIPQIIGSLGAGSSSTSISNLTNNPDSTSTDNTTIPQQQAAIQVANEQQGSTQPSASNQTTNIGSAATQNVSDTPISGPTSGTPTTQNVSDTPISGPTSGASTAQNILGAAANAISTPAQAANDTTQTPSGPQTIQGIYQPGAIGWNIVGTDANGQQVVLETNVVQVGFTPTAGESAGQFTVTPGATPSEATTYSPVVTGGSSTTPSTTPNPAAEQAYAAVDAALKAGTITQDQANAALDSIDAQYGTSQTGSASSGDILANLIASSGSPATSKTATSSSSSATTGTSGSLQPSTGTSGFSGSNTGNGAVGTSGYGVSGTSGYSGSGTSGYSGSGTSGYSGSGTSGYSGSGTSGDSGSGTSGYSGSGTFGYRGSGTSGDSGSGTSGYSGSGTSGYSGSDTGTGTGTTGATAGTPGFLKGTQIAMPLASAYSVPVDNYSSPTYNPQELQEIQMAKKGGAIKRASGGITLPLSSTYNIPIESYSTPAVNPQQLQEIQQAANGGIIHKADGGGLMHGSPVQHANLFGMRGVPLTGVPHLQMGGQPNNIAYQDRTLPEGHNPQFFSEGGLNSIHHRYVTGAGDGTSDSIPAMLANGEFVIPADVVSSLGNGSNDSGAKVLDAFLKTVREHKQKHDAKHLPPDSKGALAYLLQAKQKASK